MAGFNWQQYKIINSFHQNSIYKSLNNIYFISRNGKEIILEDKKKYIEFISCSYLGLDQHPQLKIQKSDFNLEIGIIFSSSRARLQPLIIKNIENNFDKIFNSNTILFPNIHTTTLGILPLICSGEMPSFQSKKQLLVIIDKFAHASIQINRGLLEQFGECKMADCDNLLALERILLNYYQDKQILIITDSVRSTGIGLQIKNLHGLSVKYNAWLYFDDAHGMSLFGKYGAGYASNCFNGEIPKNVIIVTSLAKGFGVSGAVLLLPTKLDVNFVRTYCSTYIFSGQFHVVLLESILRSTKIHLSKKLSVLQTRLWEKIDYFDSLFENKGLIVNHKLKSSPIRGIFIGDEGEAINFGEHLKRQGILVAVSAYPIVKKGEAFIRVLICANHTKSQIKLLARKIKEYGPIKTYM